VCLPDKRRTASHCEECGGTIFQQHSEWVRLRPLRVCSQACLYARELKRQKAARAARGRQETRTCQYCGQEFRTFRADARTCSTRCRVALHRTRLSAQTAGVEQLAANRQPISDLPFSGCTPREFRREHQAAASEALPALQPLSAASSTGLGRFCCLGCSVLLLPRLWRPLPYSARAGAIPPQPGEPGALSAEALPSFGQRRREYRKGCPLTLPNSIPSSICGGSSKPTRSPTSSRPKPGN
jgi:hypothetical protein